MNVGVAPVAPNTQVRHAKGHEVSRVNTVEESVLIDVPRTVSLVGINYIVDRVVAR